MQEMQWKSIFVRFEMRLLMPTFSDLSPLIPKLLRILEWKSDATTVSMDKPIHYHLISML